MTQTDAPPSADELFLQWKQFLSEGALTSAAVVAANHPDLVDPLQLLINSYLNDRAKCVDETLSTFAGRPGEAEPMPVVPDYTIIGPLGGGGMGVVYRVRDALDREFALKMVRQAQLTQAGRERFRDEARAMVSLDGHPHVVKVQHYGEHAGRPYFLMPVYPGNLTSRLTEYQANPAKAVRLMAAVADGVGYLHAKGFVHRDLKPHNILLSADGQPAVSDFGLVKSLADVVADAPANIASDNGSAETRPSGARRSRTMAGAAIGTRAYMAPDQAAGLTHLSGPKWDVWALGVILHELLTGHRPMSSESPQRLLDPRAPDNPPPSVVKPGLDPWLDRIIRKCLARDEKNRYANAGEVAAALRAWLSESRGRIRFALVASGLLVAIAVTLAITLWPAKNPATADQETLGRGEPVTLVAPGAPPKWMNVAIGPASAVRTDPSAERAPMRLDTHNALLVDLSPDPAIDQYRLEVEMSNTGPPTSHVGLYIGRHLVLAPKGSFHTFAALTFTNGGSKGPNGERTGRWDLIIRSVHEDAAGNHVHRNQQVKTGNFPIANAGLDSGWHTVAVDVSPTTLTWYFDGQQVASIPCQPERLDQLAFQRRLGLASSELLAFTPRQAVGVCNLSGVAVCRSAKLIPVTK